MTNGEKQRWMSLPMFVLACVLMWLAYTSLGGCTTQQNYWRDMSKVIQRSGA